MDVMQNLVIQGQPVAKLFHYLAGRTVIRTFVLYLVAFYDRPEIASGVISGSFVRSIVREKRLKFRARSLNLSREIPPDAPGGGIFDCF